MDYNNQAQSQYRDQPNRFSPTAAEPAQSESPSRIRDGITHAEQTLSNIHDAIQMLEKRLDTVLRPVPPSTVNAATPKTQLVGSHMLGRIEILNEGFDAAVQRLHGLAERVEV